MDRERGRRRWVPRRNSAGVEVGGELGCDELSFLRFAHAAVDFRRVAFCGGHDGLDARVDHADWFVECHAASAMNGWTDRSSLVPKPPPTGVGMMRTRLGGEARSLADVGAVHVGRLSAGLDFDSVAVFTFHILAVPTQAGEAGLGLDGGVLDESCFKFGFYDGVRGG